MSGLKFPEILILLLVVLLLFGANRLPDLARSVGKSLKIFKAEVKDITAKDEAVPGATPPAVTTLPPTATPVPPTTPGVAPDDSGRVGS